MQLHITDSTNNERRLTGDARSIFRELTGSLDDFSSHHNCSIRLLDAAEATFCGLRFSQTTFQGNATSADFGGCQFEPAWFRTCELPNSQWDGVRGNVFFKDCDLSGALFADASRVTAHFQNCKLHNATLPGAGADILLHNCDLRGAKAEDPTRIGTPILRALHNAVRGMHPDAQHHSHIIASLNRTWFEAASSGVDLLDEQSPRQLIEAAISGADLERTSR